MLGRLGITQATTGAAGELSGHTRLHESTSQEASAAQLPDGLFEQVQKLLADDGQADDFFGTSVTLAGDTALISAFRDDNENGGDADAVYVFTCQNGQWTQIQKLLANDGQSQDEFGRSVAFEGDMH